MKKLIKLLTLGIISTALGTVSAYAAPSTYCIKIPGSSYKCTFTDLQVKGGDNKSADFYCTINTDSTKDKTVKLESNGDVAVDGFSSNMVNMTPDQLNKIYFSAYKPASKTNSTQIPFVTISATNYKDLTCGEYKGGDRVKFNG